MRHDICLEGHAFRLRPVGDADAPLIVRLRSDGALNRFLHASSLRVEDQLEWLGRYYERPGDYYFAVEALASGEPEGVISLYDVDAQAQRGEWGRWILSHGSLAAVESAWLVYRIAFDVVGLEEVYCRTVAANAAVVSFHDSCGITDRRVLPNHFELGGKAHDAVEHCVDQAAWSALEPRLSRLAQLTAWRFARG
jgi:RimJ/RimL family protein N-acetyltransferase